MTDATLPADNLVAGFQIETMPVRGRIVRLGEAVDAILKRHEYPEPVANLLGEACALAALVGASLKFEGRLIVQAQGDGPVAYVVADYDTSGALRGYCRFDPARVDELSHGYARPGAHTLLGKGVFVMTVDQGPDMDRHQGITPIEGETLALCAEHYFFQSEQLPTKVLLGVAEVDGNWRAGGAMIQLVAGDETRGETQEAWTHVNALFQTLGEEELTDGELTTDRLLYRLFHEDGVRMFDTKALKASCRCSPEGVLGMLRAFPIGERAEMIEDDGMIRVTCEYCSRVYEIEPEGV